VRSKVFLTLIVAGLVATVPATAGAATEKQQNRKIKKLEQRLKSLRTRVGRLEQQNAAITNAFGGLVSCFGTVKVSRFGNVAGTNTDGYDYTDATAQTFKVSALDVDESATGGTDFVLATPACAAIFNGQAPSAAAFARVAPSRALAPFAVSLTPRPKLAP
jgi:hypothetical protein